MTKHQHNARHHQHPTKTDFCLGRAKHGPATGFAPFLGRIAGPMHATGTGSVPPEAGWPIRSAGLEKARARQHLSRGPTRVTQRP